MTGEKRGRNPHSLKGLLQQIMIPTDPQGPVCKLGFVDTNFLDFLDPKTPSAMHNKNHNKMRSFPYLGGGVAKVLAFEREKLHNAVFRKV